MIIKQVEVARKFNLGNFETQDIKLTADLEEGENETTLIQTLKETIKAQGAK